jgi:hypothetical protein
VGDVIDLAYSILWQNPVLDGHFMGSFGLGERHPILRLRRDVIIEHDRPSNLQWQLHGQGGFAPRVIDGPKRRVITWALADLAPILLEDRLPGGYHDIPWVQLTEFGNWEDVVKWGIALYSLNRPFDIDLKKQATEFRESSMSVKDQALRAVRFVQDDVRYLSISIGPHSHRPHDPAQVLKQRFGDCKDKSLLLVALLQELGVEAYVALVNTEFQGSLTKMLPSVFVFDHVVVKVIIDGKTIWIDATASTSGFRRRRCVRSSPCCQTFRTSFARQR